MLRVVRPCRKLAEGPARGPPPSHIAALEAAEARARLDLLKRAAPAPGKAQPLPRAAIPPTHMLTCLDANAFVCV